MYIYRTHRPKKKKFSMSGNRYMQKLPLLLVVAVAICPTPHASWERFGPCNACVQRSGFARLGLMPLREVYSRSHDRYTDLQLGYLKK